MHKGRDELLAGINYLGNLGMVLNYVNTEFLKYNASPYEGNISYFRMRWGLYLGNAKFFRKSYFKNVLCSKKIAHEVHFPEFRCFPEKISKFFSNDLQLKIFRILFSKNLLVKISRKKNKIPWYHKGWAYIWRIWAISMLFYPKKLI